MSVLDTVRNLVLRRRFTLDVHGADELGAYTGPVVIAANYASAADPRLVRAALPRAWRRGLVVVLPAEDGRRGTADLVEDALAENRSVLCFPEDARSRDGYLGRFRAEILGVPMRRGVAVLPVGLRGSYAAVPDDTPLPVPLWRRSAEGGRPRVSVRLGSPTRAAAGEAAPAFAHRVEQEVRRLIAEDASSWWDTQRQLEAEPVAVPGSSWRRIWEQTEAPTAGGRPRRPRIWRS